MLFLMTCRDFEMSEIRFCKVNLFKLSVLCAIVDIKLKNKTYCFLSVCLSTITRVCTHNSYIVKGN